MTTHRRGFTLIEMLIVIAIVGILATLVLVGLGPVQKQGRDARRVSDLRQVENALALYYNQNGKYPTGVSSWGALQTALAVSAGASINQVNDPTPAGQYAYGVDANGTVFVLGAQLEDKGNSVMKQSLTAFPVGIGSWSTPTTGWGSTTCGASGSGIYCISL